MSESVLKHQCRQGERWDLLAHRYYGDASLMGTIIDANPHLAISETLTEGQIAYIPIIHQSIKSTQGLPPWMQ